MVHSEDWGEERVRKEGTAVVCGAVRRWQEQWAEVRALPFELRDVIAIFSGLPCLCVVC